MASLCIKTPLAGKGEGLIATRPIMRGELIHCEPSLLTLDAGPFDDFDDVTYFAGNGNTRQARNAAATYIFLDQAQKDGFAGLAHDGDHNPKSRLFVWSRVQRNNFTFRSNDDTAKVCVFNVISKANHDCLPNAILSLQEGSNDIGMLYALRNISWNEEILINYLHEYTWNNRDYRVVQLQTHWNFTCGCFSCSMPNFMQGDQARQRVGMLAAELELNEDEGWKNITGDLQERSSKLMELHDLLKNLENMGYKADLFAKVCLALAKCHEKQAQRLDAQDWANDAVICMTDCFGDDGSYVGESRRYRESLFSRRR